MAIDNEYVLHGISLPGGQFFSQITNQSVSPELALLMGQGAGIDYPMFAGMLTRQPYIQFTTTQLKTLVTVTSGGPCAALSGGNIDLYFRRITPQSRRDAVASTTGYRMRATLGHLYWTRFSARQGDQAGATADVRIALCSDGTNAILTPAGSQAMSGTPSFAERFILGPWKINGTLVPGVQEVTIESGAQQIIESDSGGVDPNFVAQASWAPVVTLRTPSMANWTAQGIGVTSHAVIGYFRQLGATGATADGSSVHLLGTTLSAVIQIEESNTDGRTPVRTGLRCTCVGGSSAEPWTWTNDSAIT